MCTIHVPGVLESQEGGSGMLALVLHLNPDLLQMYQLVLTAELPLHPKRWSTFKFIQRGPPNAMSDKKG